MPRVRFTVRGMMVAVAIVGMACGGELIRRRRNYYLNEADTYAYGERIFRESADEPLEGCRAGQVSREAQARFKVETLATADHYAALKRKYARAARYPWLPVAPDPPEPE